jgi:hypothetical protein
MMVVWMAGAGAGTARSRRMLLSPLLTRGLDHHPVADDHRDVAVPHRQIIGSSGSARRIVIASPEDPRQTDGPSRRVRNFCDPLGKSHK